MFNQDTFLSDDQQGIEISQLMSDFGIFLQTFNTENVPIVYLDPSNCLYLDLTRQYEVFNKL